jgi:hypothetical protein
MKETAIQLQPENLPDEPLLTPQEVVERYGLSFELLEDLRVAKVGLSYYLFPDAIVRYERRTVETWLQLFEIHREKAKKALCASSPEGEFQARLSDPTTRDEALFEIDTVAMERMEKRK